MRISIVIPAHNEQSRIEPTVVAYARYFTGHEIIVVCNGCGDSTPAIVERLSTEYPGIRLLVHARSLGKGGAIVEGIRHASGEIVGFVDADESVAPCDFDHLCAELQDFDAAIASRRVAGARILLKQPIPRRLASRAFNVFVRLVFGLELTDTQCGAKAFRTSAIGAVVDGILSTGFEFDVELLWRLRRQGYSVTEVPITWRHSPGSTFSLLCGPRMLLSLLRLRLWT